MSADYVFRRHVRVRTVPHLRAGGNGYGVESAADAKISNSNTDLRQGRRHGITEDENIVRFHIEMRQPDAMQITETEADFAQDANTRNHIQLPRMSMAIVSQAFEFCDLHEQNQQLLDRVNNDSK